MDPNVWISALINPRGVPAQVVQLVMAGDIVPLVTAELLNELGGVLQRPKFRRWIKLEDAVAFVDALRLHSETVETAPPTQTTRDPKDVYLVAMSEASGAQIITGDADLLDAELQPPAVTPQQFLATWNG
ncbi:putative toxin-antitoxin system toxin component, PIN family [Tenggerimyces flavus]|uniref:putative toxin-antitoxin system toxin component, PIN family n=1 Tax=Tenggerimyces flavus TaxID=1708749 RepID=UPI0027DA2A4E|nr:putative toxin-antitoxin system toxin component, PIN family [Tenggerimyces flavus]